MQFYNKQHVALFFTMSPIKILILAGGRSNNSNTKLNRCLPEVRYIFKLNYKLI